MTRPAIPIVLVAMAVGVASAQPTGRPAAAVSKTYISFAEARPVLETLHERVIPAELRVATPAERDATWPQWIAGHDRAIRLRLERGDEDSIVNLLLFGVTFTAQPRTSIRDMLRLLVESRGEEMLQSRAIQLRIADLIAAVAPAGGAALDNERLDFARRVFDRKGLGIGQAVVNAEHAESAETKTSIMKRRNHEEPKATKPRKHNGHESERDRRRITFVFSVSRLARPSRRRRC